MQLKEAGFEAKPARAEDVDLVALLQQHVGDLPQVIVDALPATPTPDPRQEGKEAGDVLRSSVGKLRDLGQRKLRLQEEIDTRTTCEQCFTRCRTSRMPSRRQRWKSRRPPRNMKTRWSSIARKRSTMEWNLSCRLWACKRPALPKSKRGSWKLLSPMKPSADACRSIQAFPRVCHPRRPR